MKYRKKLLIVFFITCICAILFQFGRISIYRNNTIMEVETIENEELILNSLSSEEMEKGQRKALIIYNQDDTLCLEETKNMENFLKHLRFTIDLVSENTIQSKDFDLYDCIIVNVHDYDLYASNYVYDIFSYVRKGGKALFSCIPNNIGGVFSSIYRQLGIRNINQYTLSNGIYFSQDLIPNTQGLKLEDKEALQMNSLSVSLDNECEVYLENLEKVPLFWIRPIEKGKISFYNASNLGEKYAAGIFAGIISTLNDDFIYPIINAMTIFIDDFPSPQYNNESQEIYEEYNRNVKEFYRDIWWPDMQKIAKKYQLKYTGLFVSTYNNIVDPNDFVFEDSQMIAYYGKSLLKNNFEMGLHGYNHQSLALEGFIPEEMGYVPWKNKEDMEKSIVILREYAEKLFPGSIFKTYVAPSNYLSPEGRSILPKAMPDIEVISGIYVVNEEEKNALQQDFGIDDDNIVSFPRLSSGMWNDNIVIYESLAGLGLYGVFSHFIHPDDILNDERGKNAYWSEMLESFDMLLDNTVQRFSSLRRLTASNAGRATRVYESIQMMSSINDNQMTVQLNGFQKEAYFYLRTNQIPKSMMGDGYVLKKLSQHYYLVEANKAKFTIEWK